MPVLGGADCYIFAEEWGNEVGLSIGIHGDVDEFLVV